MKRTSSGPCVSNSGPLIHLASINRLGLLKEIFATVIIPDAVKVEIVDRGREAGAADAILIEDEIKSGWIQVRRRKGNRAVAERAGIDEGEAAAITMAKKLGMPVLLDDASARSFAMAFGVEVAGSVAVVLRSAKLDIISPHEAIDALDDLAVAMWLSPGVYRKARKVLDNI